MNPVKRGHKPNEHAHPTLIRTLFEGGAVPPDHASVLRKQWVQACRPGLDQYSSPERQVLCDYGEWFFALTRSQIAPTNPAQQRFVQVARGQVSAESPIELLWIRFAGVAKAVTEGRSETTVSADREPRTPTEAWYRREERKPLHDMLRRERRERFRE